jgi:dynein heavy chain 2
VWKVDDFVAKWSKAASEGRAAGARATAGGDDPVALILLQELDNYRRCLPQLKTTLRGAGWETEHWQQVC